MNVEVGSSEDRKYYKIYDEFYNKINDDMLLKSIISSTEYNFISYYGDTIIQKSASMLVANTYKTITEISFIKIKVYGSRINPQMQIVTSFDDVINELIAQGAIPSDIKNYYKEISKEESNIYQLIGE